MTVASETNRSGPYSGNGVTTVFAYDFRIVDQSHLQVIRTDAAGDETTLALLTDYTVSGVGSAAGGSITLTTALPAGNTVTILRNIPFTQETDLENQGAYYAQTVEDALDLAVMRDQQLAEKLNRAVLVPATETDPTGALASQLAADITRLADSADNIDTVADSIADVNTVADNVADLNTVADNIGAIVAAVGSVLDLADASFTGDGSNDVFTLPAPATADQNVLVWVGGVRQVPGDDYSVSGTMLTLTAIPGAGVAIDVLVITAVTAQAIFDLYGELQKAVNIGRCTVLATAGQTTYAVSTDGDPLGLTPSNHILIGPAPFGALTYGVDYTVTEAGALVLAFSPREGDLLHLFLTPRTTNEEAQQILNEFQAMVAGDADRAEVAADAAAGSATAAATSATAAAGSATSAAGSASQAASANNYASRALAVTAATSSTWPVGAVIRDSSVSYRYVGSGTAIADMPGWLPHGAASSLHWGAGLGTSLATVDDAALAAALAFTTPRSEFLTLDGNIYIHDQVAFTGAPLIRGGARHAIYHVDGPNKAALKCTVVGGAHSGVIDGVVATSTTLTANTDNAFIEFVGDTSSILSNCSFVNNFISNFYSGVISNIDARTTPFGLEGGVNWSKFSGNDFRNVFNGYRFRKGTGTGNTFLADVPRIRPGGSYFTVDPVASGHVAGDVMLGFCHGNGLGGDATFLRIGAGTVYGGQWSLLGNQFDAGMVKPIELPTDHQYTNFNLSGNNWGGASKLGTYIAPLVRSVVDDRDVSRWMAGNTKSSAATGIVSFDVFEIEFGIGDYVGAAFEVEVSAFIPGVGMRFATADYWVESIAGTMTITTMRSAVYVNATGGLGITVTNSGTKKANVAIGWNKSGGGTAAAVSQVNIRGRGVSPFKITRL